MSVCSKTSSSGDKPHANIGTMGHIDHGKTTLTAAITKALSEGGDSGVHRLRGHRQGAGGAAAGYHDQHRAWSTDGEPSLRVDMPGHADYIKNMITGAAQVDGAILVVSAADGPMPQTREHVLLARQVGIAVDRGGVEQGRHGRRRELLDLVELEVRELLSEYDFPGDDVPVVKVSALQGVGG